MKYANHTSYGPVFFKTHLPPGFPHERGIPDQMEQFTDKASVLVAGGYNHSFCAGESLILSHWYHFVLDYASTRLISSKPSDMRIPGYMIRL